MKLTQQLTISQKQHDIFGISFNKDRCKSCFQEVDICLFQMRTLTIPDVSMIPAQEKQTIPSLSFTMVTDVTPPNEYQVGNILRMNTRLVAMVTF